MYIILEIQLSNDGTMALSVPLTFENRNQAEQAYHQTLSYAAVSSVDVHSVCMLNGTGDLIMKQTYFHGAEPVA